MVELTLTRALRFDGSHSLCLMVPQRITESLVKLEWDDWLRKLIEVSPEDVRSIVNGIACPVKTFAVAIWAVKGSLKLFDALFAASKPENTLNIGRYAPS